MGGTWPVSNFAFQILSEPLEFKLAGDGRSPGRRCGLVSPTRSSEGSNPAERCPPQTTQASSGGWDFVPYTETREGNITARNYSVPRTFSRGIWRSVYVSTGPVAVLHVVPQILYTGSFSHQNPSRIRQS